MLRESTRRCFSDFVREREAVRGELGAADMDPPPGGEESAFVEGDFWSLGYWWLWGLRGEEGVRYNCDDEGGTPIESLE